MQQLQTVSLQEALECALNAAKGKKETKTVLLNDALGKVLAEDITARKNLPSFDNSAMDGFAFKAKDAGKTLKIKTTIFAGDVPQAILQEGECYKIMTGGQVPRDADTISPFDQCETIDETSVTLPSSIKQGANLRKKGEETTLGKTLLQKGTRLESSHIALLAAQGIVAVKVVLPLKIAVLSSGNEIKEPWERASEDEIYNANAFGITSLLQSFGFDAVYAGKIPDDFETTKNYLADIKSYDVIITTGGISHGEADYLYEAFLQNGLEPLFHGVRVKPGHPTMMGVMGEIFVMGLPGNPLTTMVMAHTLAIPVLFKLQGASKWHHLTTKATLAQPLTLKGKRAHLVLGTLQNGMFTPTRGGKVGSGMLLPLCESNAIAYFNETETRAWQKGESIGVVVLNDQTRRDLF